MFDSRDKKWQSIFLKARENNLIRNGRNEKGDMVMTFKTKEDVVFMFMWVAKYYHNYSERIIFKVNE